MLDIKHDDYGRVHIIRISGDIDEEGVRHLRMPLVGALLENWFDVVLDFTGVKFISYMGVGVLVERLRQFRSYDGDLKILNPNNYVRRLMRMTGVAEMFVTLDDLSDLETLEEKPHIYSAAGSLEVWVDPGDAEPEQIAELLTALSDLQRACGGVGLEFGGYGPLLIDDEQSRVAV